MKDRFFVLVTDYLEEVNHIVKLLREFFGTTEILEASRERKIRSGTYRGMDFKFHGIGCRTELQGKSTNFDFGTGGRFDGFDGWRLWEFAIERRIEYPEFNDLNTIENKIQEAIALGLIEKSETDSPSPHLFYLSPGAKF